MPRPLSSATRAVALLLLGLTAPAVAAQITWSQLGADIDGEAAGDESGGSVSLWGHRLAVGARFNDGNGESAGHARVFEWDGSAWAQMGADIDGEATLDQAGFSVSLWGDRLAVSAQFNDGNGPGSGHVRVFEWDGTAWVQMGPDIDGEASGDFLGTSVSLSGDRLAVGARGNDGTGVDAGHVRVYEWNGTAWVQLGADIDGEAAEDQSGHSVSLWGDRLAVGARFNDGNGESAGHARVFEWDGSSWAQLGADIDGEDAGDLSGNAVSLSGDRLAVGASLNDGIGTNAGHVRVYEWDGTAWVQMGADIDGEARGDFLGTSVSLSGDRLATGARGNDEVGENAGHARVFEWDGSAWVPFGADIDGEAAGDRAGDAVSLSGNRLAIGAPTNDGSGLDAGHARVFSVPGQLAVAPGAAVYWPLDEALVHLDVVTAPVHSLSGVLGYDDTRLTYVGGSYALSPLFGTAPTASASDDGAGAFTFSGGRADDRNVSDDGTAASLRFTVADAAAPGPVALTLSNVDAEGNTGAPFAFDTVMDGAFTVGGVWPGDLDDDGEVNAADLLVLGLHFGETGPARPGDREANLQWGARAFTPWGGSSAHADFPRSFADGDGNGTITESDLFALSLNFGATHTVPRTATSAGLTAEPLVIALDAATGATVAFDVSLAGSADALVGAAIRLGHGSTGAEVVGVEAGSLFVGAMESVHLGTLEAQAAFAHRGRANAVSGEGTLFRVVARVDAAGATLTVPSFEVATGGGSTAGVDPAMGLVVSSANAVAGRGEDPAALQVLLGPNPARSAARIALLAPEAGEVTVDVFDALGRRVAGVQQTVAAGSAEIALPVSSLAPGLYVVRVSGLGQVLSRTLTVAR